jgi:type II secretory pathway pseudopilin PulG
LGLTLGFTLIEIIIVFILLGILAVAVVPTLTEMDDVGYDTVQQGTLGALRTAWPNAYANAGNTAPTSTQVSALVTGTDDAACSCNGSFEIVCGGVKQANGTTDATFGVAAATSCDSTIDSAMSIVLISGG